MNAKNKKLLSKINSEKKQTSLKKIKRKKHIELILITSLFLIVFLFIGYMFSPYTKLKNINVSGYNQTTEEEILSAGAVDTNLRTWSIKDDEIAKNIKNKYNILKNVKVTSKMPNNITIEVEEYKLVAQNKKEDGQYEVIMENGETYNGEIRNNYSLPILENFKNDRTKVSAVYNNLAQLKEEILSEISEIINDEGKETITIYMKDGQKVKALSSSFSEKLNYYDSMAKYIKDKNKTILNLVNGAYLETEKTDKEKTKKIKDLLSKSGNGEYTVNSDNSNFSTKNNTLKNSDDNKENSTEKRSAETDTKKNQTKSQKQKKSKKKSYNP
ncbi:MULTISPECIES: cell division protein FtsQ/DivIB [Gemella]|uniref:cell division protein FtsQ/DivIB n=1 Tax=Gemella TaxID=1378 RepID=UPI0007681625|nr:MULTISPECIES: FtsQ-type POTRA domain-containing protein [Gemella]AME09289.1 hypothetical protein AXE85_03565 [Gemella sp. oral taxon 928]AXI26924.1 hypothetical protein CG018_05705 [Gemella sp. ND 6198]